MPLLCFLALAGTLAPGLAASWASETAIFRKIEIVPRESGIEFSIQCSLPVAPQVRRLHAPERLVIDLPNTRVAAQPQPIRVDSPDVRAIRINQFQADPPVTRIVLDLVGAREYSLANEGSTLNLRVQSEKLTPSITVARTPVAPAGVLVSGSRVPEGSAVTAGADTATMRLARGGEVRVCPGTTVSVTPAQNSRDLMLGMSTGALELHYVSTTSADTVLTPDFRIVLAGPGEFHYAISTDARGDTCVRSLAGNQAPALISELMGDSTYQVKPLEQVVFRGGRLRRADANVPFECGCPPQRPPQLLAAVPTEGAKIIATGTVPGPFATPAPGGSQASSLPSTPVPVPPGPANEVHVQVDAPFIFRAQASPAATQEVARLTVVRNTAPQWIETVAMPLSVDSSAATATPKPASPHNHDLFSAIKGLFRKLFG